MDNISDISAKYDTVATVVTLAFSPNWTRILEANPRRWSVTFIADGVATNIIVAPAPVQNTITAGFDNQSYPQTYLFRDMPSAVAGEWYGFAPVGGDLLIWECVYAR
jgi:hypothetical protein